MYDERENQTLPEPNLTDDAPPVENGGIKVYERPERRPLPIWIWLAALLALALVGWIILQSMQ